MGLPKVTVAFSNNNLLQDIAAVDGICGIVGTAVTGPLQGVVSVVYNLADAVAKGYTSSAEPHLFRHIREFYEEVAGNQELHVLGLADTVTMTQMVTNTNVDGARKLTQAAGGKIRVLAISRKPPVGYSAGADYLDADVAAAVTAAKVFAEARVTELSPLRILIEGRVADETDAVVYEPKTAGNGYAGVVLGGSLNDGSASVGTALGRCAKYPAHIKIGKVANGPTAIVQAYIGTKKVNELLSLETLHDKGYILLMAHPQKSGFYFGKDNMASIDDYRTLSNGRVVDKAAVISAATYVNQIEAEVDVNADGKITSLEVEHLKGIISQQIQVGMAEQISALDVYINPDQNIVNTGTLAVRLAIVPKGYTSTINIEIGLRASL